MLPRQVKYETQVFEETQALNKQFAELNSVYPAEVRRTKKVLLDLMTVDEASPSLAYPVNSSIVILCLLTSPLNFLTLP